MTNEINNYLSLRYPKYLEYANYHSERAKMNQQGGDILNEVMLSLLDKDPGLLNRLFRKKNKGYRELEYYILRMIKLNCYSDFSPYKHKYNTQKTEQILTKIFEGLDDRYELVFDIVEETEPEDRRFDIAVEMLNRLGVTERAKEIFIWKLSGNSWKEWTGEEKIRTLQRAFKKLKSQVICELNNRKCTYRRQIKLSKLRQNNIKRKFRYSLFPNEYLFTKTYQQSAKVHNKYKELLTQIA